MTTPYCDECKHYNPMFYELDVSACHKGHSPRYYIPQTHRQAMDMDFGHKKAKCPDREQAKAGEHHMTTEQPLALRLADELMDGMSDEHWSQLKADAAAELRRLHAENEALREACAKVCDGWTHADGDQCAATRHAIVRSAAEIGKAMT